MDDKLSKPGMSTEELRAVLVPPKPFHTRTGNLRGMEWWGLGQATEAGDLPEPYLAQFVATEVDYIIYSYRTPIAWFVNDTGEWFVPNVNYSLTTTQHQSAVKGAIQDYVKGPFVNLRTGRGNSPYGPRSGW